MSVAVTVVVSIAPSDRSLMASKMASKIGAIAGYVLAAMERWSSVICAIAKSPLGVNPLRGDLLAQGLFELGLFGRGQVGVVVDLHLGVAIDNIGGDFVGV